MISAGPIKLNNLVGESRYLVLSFTIDVTSIVISSIEVKLSKTLQIVFIVSKRSSPDSRLGSARFDQYQKTAS